MRNRASGIVFLFFILTGMGDLFAQTIPLRHFTVEDGLPSNIVYSITRQKNGYLWFPTDKGAAVFNGTSFKTFTTADGLPDNDIFNIREDYEGRLWFTTFNGELCYYKDQVFHTARNTPWLKLPFKSNQLRSIMQKDGSVTIIFSDQSKFVNILGNSLKVISIPQRLVYELLVIEKLPGKNYKLVYPDRDVEINDSGRIVKAPLIKRFSIFFQISSYSLGDPDYYFADSSIYSFNYQKQFTFKKTSISSGHQVSIKVIGKDFFTGMLNNLVINDSIHISMGQQVTYIETDKDGNFWVSTKGKGIYLCSKYYKDIREHLQAYDNQIVYARTISNDLFFVNNMGTVYRFRNGKVLPLVVSKNTEVSLTRANFLINDQASFFRYAGWKNYVITALSQSNRQVPVNIETNGGIKEILHKGDYVYLSSVNHIFRTRYNDLLQEKPENRKIDDDTSVHATRIYSRAIDPADNSLWYSRANAVYKIRDTICSLQPQLKNITFRQLTFFGQYFVGITEGNKLVICNNYEGSKVVLDTVPEPNCVWEYIYPIDRRRMLITTSNYHRLLTLYPVAPQHTPRYTLQTIEDPFIPRQVECVATDTGYCSFFKEGTLTQIKTSVLFEQTAAPGSVFVSFKTQNKNYPIRPAITIPYSESGSINLTFDNLSFEGKEIVCEYSISRDNQDKWVRITGNAINLNTPGFGSYIIKVRAKTLSSNYSSPAVLRLTVLKPFWATWWFITISLLLLLALVILAIYLVTWLKLRKEKRQHESEMKYQQSEYKALNALMNPHFIFNSLNNIQGLINKDEKRIANEYLVIFSDLVRQNMNNISKGFISLQQELNLVENYLNLEKLRFKELVNYEINIEEDVETDDIMIPPLMIQPLVENAVKHGLLPKQSPDSQILIHVYEENELLYIEIQDNGIGLTQSLQNKNKLYESFGLVNLQKRTEHLRKIQQREISIQVSEMKDSTGLVLGSTAVIKMDLKDN